MTTVAVLIDAGCLWKISNTLLHRYWKEKDFISLAHTCLRKPDESLFRIFFYDCLPFDGTSKHPLSREVIEYGTGRFFQERKSFLENLAAMDYVALRKGTLHHRGWTLKKRAIKNLMNGKKTEITESDIQESFQQKAVDMKIGLDVAWLSSRRIVDKLILVGMDSDYVPAMKHARREGCQVVIVDFPHVCSPTAVLREHADECRKIRYDSATGFILDTPT